ncbi:phosphatase PAP2 family protein [Ancylobacter sp.]|uniref:phosphatase PAP2 family protein n=1 Tax=Ancylobacter sp. TaxID=1872567 RepID=UPI003D0DAE46
MAGPGRTGESWGERVADAYGAGIGANPRTFPRLTSPKMTRPNLASRAPCRWRPLLLAGVATALVSAVFYLFPGIDRSVTRLFFVPGKGFPAARIGALQDFRLFASHVSLAVPLLLAIGLGLMLAWPRKPGLVPPRLSLYMVSLFLAGPVVLVNGVLKPFWGRPRPVNVTDFGGPWPFQQPWVIGAQGLANHSFSSGEAAASACLLPLILFVPRPWRWQVGALLVAFVALVGLNRIAVGAHFLSDVVISIGLMLVLAAGLHPLIVRRGGAMKEGGQGDTGET